LALLNTRIASTRFRYLAYALAGLITALAVLIPVAVAEAKKKKKDPKITVMSRNLYLGADLGPAIDADSLCGAIDAGGQILNDVDESNFPERAKLLAAEIADAKPDLVGLQEVALWRYQEEADFEGSDATEVRYDFLKSLKSELGKAGAKYKVAVVQNEFDQELPGDIDGKDQTQDAGVPLCGADADGRLTMRDAILVRKGSKVKVSDPQMAHFENLYSVTLAGAIPIDVERGWVSVEAKVKKTKKQRGAKFRFVNTHLEAFGDPAIREAQARELFEEGGPLITEKPLILLGDINSGGPKDKVGTGFTNPGDEGAYNALTQDFGMKKYGARQTCCYPDVFANVIKKYRFDHTVDHILVKPGNRFKEISSFVTGDDPDVNITAKKLVASDHGGVVSKIKLKKKK
jgi:endonuclease/exonuclease/phosphatase family metal-dependent hydrolase